MPRPTVLADRVRTAPAMTGAALAEEVSTTEPYVVEALGEKRFRVAAIDLGIKAMTPQLLAEHGIEVHVLPQWTTFDEIAALAPDGVFFSNGPGDPAAAESEVALLRQVLDAGHPVLRHLLRQPAARPRARVRHLQAEVRPPGHQPAGHGPRAPGRSRSPRTTTGSPSTRPLDRDSDTPYGRARVSHVCLNDEVVEGIECLDIPAYSVQYHPEAAAGPHDAAYLFDRFVALMNEQQTGADA